MICFGFFCFSLYYGVDLFIFSSCVAAHFFLLCSIYSWIAASKSQVHWKHCIQFSICKCICMRVFLFSVFVFVNTDESSWSFPSTWLLNSEASVMQRWWISISHQMGFLLLYAGIHRVSTLIRSLALLSQFVWCVCVCACVYTGLRPKKRDSNVWECRWMTWMTMMMIRSWQPTMVHFRSKKYVQ